MSRINPQHVYFITDARRSSVKIGIAVDPERRLLDLQAGNHTTLRLDLVLYFQEVGAAGRYEDALHQQFAAYWKHREWFQYAEPIRAFVDAWKRCETPDVQAPRFSCKQAANEYGVGLRKDEYMAILRDRARAAQ